MAQWLDPLVFKHCIHMGLNPRDVICQAPLDHETIYTDIISLLAIQIP